MYRDPNVEIQYVTTLFFAQEITGRVVIYKGKSL